MALSVKQLLTLARGARAITDGSRGTGRRRSFVQLKPGLERGIIQTLEPRLMTSTPGARSLERKLVLAVGIDDAGVEDGDESHDQRDNSKDQPSTLSAPAISQMPQTKQIPPQHQLPVQRIRRASKRGGGGGIQWILGPLALLITGATPALLLPSHTLFSGSITAGLLALAGLDSTFHIGATAFLLMADASARGKEPDPPSELHGIPLGYKVWSFLVNFIGLVIPVAAVVMSTKGHSIFHKLELLPAAEILPVAALLGPYTFMLLVQWVAEIMVWHWNSPVWPVLPLVYQAYRLLQLTRGVELGASAVINAPGWLVGVLLKGLVAWWVFVLGMQTMWIATLVGTMQTQEQWRTSF